MPQITWIRPGKHDPADLKFYPLTDSEIKTKVIFFRALAVTTSNSQGLRININKLLEGVRDYIIEQREGLT